MYSCYGTMQWLHKFPLKFCWHFSQGAEVQKNQITLRTNSNFTHCWGLPWRFRISLLAFMNLLQGVPQNTFVVRSSRNPNTVRCTAKSNFSKVPNLAFYIYQWKAYQKLYGRLLNGHSRFCLSTRVILVQKSKIRGLLGRQKSAVFCRNIKKSYILV